MVRMGVAVALGPLVGGRRLIRSFGQKRISVTLLELDHGSAYLIITPATADLYAGMVPSGGQCEA